MNKSAIKGFSIRARRKLIQDITQKAFSLGIKDDKKYDDIEEFEGGFRVKSDKNQIVYPMELKKHRDKLIAEVNHKGYDQVMEEVAYTWFNRIIAIRFMEVNEYLPVKVRILSSETEGKIEPDVLTNVYDYVDELELDKDKVFELKENHKDEELFKYIFVKECNKLGVLMPQVFEKICDFTELLLPDQLLLSDSVIRNLIESIEEDDFKEEVEIIGWMYQYYISEKKDEVFAALKKNKKITKENIPAATQLFTPKWIVKYMTENSLGRLWQESHPNEELKTKWEYYIEPTEQEAEVQNKLDTLKDPNLSPEEIKVMDPAMGSGHILVYAFDVLYDIYLSRGYAERDIPQLILENNLYGLDIDDRAAQLATFALLMKARSKNRRFFKNRVSLNLCSIKESNGFTVDALKYFACSEDTNIEKKVRFDEIKYLIDTFKDAKEYGSIVAFDNINFEALTNRINVIENGYNLSIFEFGYRNEILDIIPNLIKQAEILSKKYDVVISNPPYMGRKGMNAMLKNYLDNTFPRSKSDLFSVFMEVCSNLTKSNGYWAMINQHSWMFLSSFERLRNFMITNKSITSMIHLGARTFEEIAGEVVQSVSFVFRNEKVDSYKGNYYRLTDIDTPHEKEIKFRDAINMESSDYHFVTNEANYEVIPGMPVAFWLSDSVISLFSKYSSLGELVDARQGCATADNNRFLRRWYECDITNIGFGICNDEKSKESEKKWFPYNKGGTFRRWYGNKEYVVNWYNGGNELKSFEKSVVRNPDYYFKESVSWSDVTSGDNAFRLYEEGFIFDSTGHSAFCNENYSKYELLALCNSNLIGQIVNVLNPTMHFHIGYFNSIPAITFNTDVSTLVKENIKICKDDWDLNETSWEFKEHPLLLFKSNDFKIETSLLNWERINTNSINQLEKNEININRIVVQSCDIEPSEELISVNKTRSIKRLDKKTSIVSFISYAIGCMFGRYSIDAQGLIHASNRFDRARFSTYEPTIDNIILITEDDYSDKDIVHRLIDFMKVTFSEETLEDNLKYTADVLNPKSKETSRQIIRNYFVKDFYKDHCKMYKKRPIYWMIESGKKKGVKALFYMHRYDKSTMARFRTDYLHEIQRAYENDIELTMKSSDGKAKKRVDDLKKKLIEVNEFDKVVAHIAHQQIEIDLDDGVEHNYELFQGIEVPQGDGSTFKANLLAKRK